MLTPEIMQALMAGFGGGQGMGAMQFPALALPNLQAAGGFFSLPHPLGAPGQMSWAPPQVAPKPVKPPVAAPVYAPAPVQKLNWRGEPIGTGTAGGFGEHDRSGRHGQGGGPGAIGRDGQAGRAGF